MTEEIRLNSSKLGTQEYWNEFYKREINNFQENEEDTGECWFDDSDAENKMIQFILDKLNEDEFPFTHEEIKFLDLGTGNGHLLFQLHEDLEEEYEGQRELKFGFTGVDYSPDSVEFSREIAAKKYPESSFSFDQVDLLAKHNNTFLLDHKQQFDILLDKGTLDAIALNQDPLPDFEGKIGMDAYADQVSQLMHSNSILLITSCNFTEEELIQIITSNKSNSLSVWGKINYPSFQFGGAKGSTICSIAFIKN
ncbi:uncharacterized protein CANTADRAFT_48903 [Suhomyces tanzawaensis NRRL Y-17324]|uniref:Protein-lysine N-methyltransferase EFM4 n=1 Tax=Suhomyces tanzawaensis NRRL Y-17324 TaxID=984487 RepID=A0A1E4SJZ8_9ASCO|nr:uncharacterized protein CANTADRAFT_48903 [Suhomyces tanzawaensis NRRL Y-17324]ODV79836.1 hypothetical protein CANTADRAFT_48903 [Suhomyces tanzawaensis NRRL Y-17324]